MPKKRRLSKKERTEEWCVLLMSKNSEEEWAYYEQEAIELGALDEFKRIKEKALRVKEGKEKLRICQ